MVRGIRPSVEGRTIRAVCRCRCTRKPILIQPSMQSISRRSRGRTIVAVRRIAKRVVLDLDSGDAFVVEPRMTGLMLLADPPSREHLRFEWELAPVAGVSNPCVPGTTAAQPQTDPAATSRLWFWDRRGLGTLRLYSAGELAERLGPPHLGPDALAMTPEQWRAALSATRREIKVALLDQTLVAGIGNLYASEILHLAGIHPQAVADRLSRRRVGQLHQATLAVLTTAIRYEGSTLSDGTYRNALNKNGSYQNEHRVYAREGETCAGCQRSRVRRIVQAQRSTFFCPGCQRR
jgi:formamidopyrimidine-DNA glycosylase